jgi:cation transport ATPase
MPDWDKLVREQMKALDLPAHVKEEVVAELRAHLEDATADSPNQTTCQPTTQHQWQMLSRAIQRAKQREDLMTDRIKRLWLVTAAVWLAATLSVMVLQRPDQPLQYLLGFYLPWLAALPLVCAAGAYFAQPADRGNNRTKRLWLSVTATWLGALLSLIVLQQVDHPNLFLRRPVPVWFPVPWLATLLLVGAAGACLAQRADAPRKARLLVATSPALLLGVAMLLLVPWYFAERYPWALIFFASDVESFVVVPGLALLLGALPFLRQRSGNSFPLPDEDARASMSPTPLPE